MPRRSAPALVLVVILIACSPETATTTSLATSSTTAAPTTAPSAPTTSTSAVVATTSGAQPADATVEVLLAPYTEMGPEWTEVFFSYGEDAQHLSTSIGGEGSVMWGPEYGTQLADGTWWFFDAANLRLAHFDADGAYLDQAPMPEDLLIGGIYFQYQMPIALDNGWVTGFGFRGDETTSILRLIDGELSQIGVGGIVSWVNTDGTHLYGLSFEDSTPQRLDPETGTVEPLEWLIARDGSRYRVTLDQSEHEVLVEMPDSGITRTLLLRFSGDPEVGAFSSIEVETGVDGTLFFFFTGAPEGNETLGIGGYLSISPSGAVSRLEPVSEPFSPSDPGTGGRLGVRPGTSMTWIMNIGEDGVHVYNRSG
ncbi:MAG: hypothetical protein WD269_05025 [Acidimicrobiia bacterium]